MLVWMVYAVEVALLLSAAAFCAERAARARRGSSRWIWLTSIMASLSVPLLVSLVAIDVLSVDWPAAVGRVIPLRSITSPALSPAIWMSGHAGDLGAWRVFDPLLTRAWLAASFLLSVGLTASALHLFWRKRTWRTATLSGIGVYVARDTGPAVVGILRPRIVIPAWILRAPAAQQAMVIAHERSHVEAGDQRLLALALCVLVCMPWNIPLWWQLRRLRNAIEIDCDARVLRSGHSAADYGEVLLVVGQRQSVFIGAVAAMSERVSFLEQRIRIMMSVPTRWRRISAVSLGALSLGIAAVAAGVTPPNAVGDAAVNREAGDTSIDFVPEKGLSTEAPTSIPVAGGEAALRELVEGIVSGAPAYAGVTPGVVQTLQQQQAISRSGLRSNGQVQSIEFRGVGSQGWANYEVRQERATTRWRITLAADGKISGALVQVGRDVDEIVPPKSAAR